MFERHFRERIFLRKMESELARHGGPIEGDWQIDGLEGSALEHLKEALHSPQLLLEAVGFASSEGLPQGFPALVQQIPRVQDDVSALDAHFDDLPAATKVEMIVDGTPCAMDASFYIEHAHHRMTFHSNMIFAIGRHDGLSVTATEFEQQMLRSNAVAAHS